VHSAATAASTHFHLCDEYAQTLTPIKKLFRCFTTATNVVGANEVKLNASTHLSTAFQAASGTREVTARALRGKRN
jgi:hypothetical protein